MKEMWPPQNNLRQLENDFFDGEVKKAIWGLGQDKTPGPDGFLLFFFRSFWPIIKHDLLNLFEEMNRRSARLDRLNYSFISLIPKNNSPRSISDYRPIAPLNSVLRIFSKILASCLTPYLQEMIG